MSATFTSSSSENVSMTIAQRTFKNFQVPVKWLSIAVKCSMPSFSPLSFTPSFHFLTLVQSTPLRKYHPPRKKHQRCGSCCNSEPVRTIIENKITRSSNCKHQRQTWSWKNDVRPVSETNSNPRPIFAFNETETPEHLSASENILLLSRMF